MKAEQVGALIKRLRQEQHVTIECICKGLCASNFLYKIERGERTPEFFLFELLLQRLGKSADRLEIILSMEEYQQLVIRDEISLAMLKGEYQLAEEKLDQYYRQNYRTGAIHKMYYIRSKAFLEYEKKNSKQRALGDIQTALMITGLRDIKIEKNTFLSSLEIENILLYVKIQYELGDNYKTKNILCKLQTYIARITDEEFRGKVLPKCYSILGDIYYQERDYNRAILLWEEAFQCLRITANSYLMIPIMERLILVYEKCVAVEKKAILQKQMEALNSLYEEYNLEYMRKECYHFESYQKEIYLDYEMIAKERIAQGMSQEKLIEGIYSGPETLSRIENGKTSPKGKKLEQLLNRLGIAKHKYNPIAQVDEFNVLELYSEINRIQMRKDYKALEKIVRKFAQSIDLENEENNRLIEQLENSMNFRLKLKTGEEILAKSYELLSDLFNIKAKNGRVPMKNEVNLITIILAICREQNRYEEAIKILKDIFIAYNKSKVKQIYHFPSYSVLMEAFTIQLEENSLLDEAEDGCDAGINFILSCGKGGGAGILLANKASVYEKKKKNFMVCKEILKKAFYLLDLFMFESDKIAIKNYFYKNYQESDELY